MRGDERGWLAEASSVCQQPGVPSEELLDLTWRLGVVAGSSEKDEAGKTFVQVNFISKAPVDGRKSSNKELVVEMSLEKFYSFLHQLEKCKASLEHARHLP